MKLGRSVSHAAALGGRGAFIIERDFVLCGEGLASLKTGRRGRGGGLGCHIITSKGRPISREYCSGFALLVGKRSYLCGEIMAVDTSSSSTPPSAGELLLPSGR